MFGSKIRMFAIILTGFLISSQLTAYSSDLKLISEKTFPVKKGELLKVESHSGDVKVTSWEKDEVNVKIYGNDNAEKDLEFDVEKSGDGVSIKIKKEGSLSNWFGSKNIKLKIEVMVPTTFNITVSTAGGDIQTNSVAGVLKLNTAGGDIKISGCAGELKANTAGGDISVYTFNGPANLNTAGGDIKAEKLKGEVDASTAGGDIKLECADGKVESSTAGGDIRIDYSGAYYGLKASTSGGDIAVRVPKSIKADIYASTFSGDIECDFDITKTKKYSNSKVEGEVNGGGEKLKCTTTGGDIKIAAK